MKNVWLQPGSQQKNKKDINGPSAFIHAFKALFWGSMKVPGDF